MTKNIFITLLVTTVLLTSPCVSVRVLQDGREREVEMRTLDPSSMSEEDLRRINPGQQGVGSIPRAGNGEFGVGAGNFRFPTEHLTTEDAEKLEKLMASDRDVAESVYKQFRTTWGSMRQDEKDTLIRHLAGIQDFIDIVSSRGVWSAWGRTWMTSQDKLTLFSQKLDTGGCTCKGLPADAEINVYRMGEIKSIPFLLGCTTYRELTSLARKSFDDSRIISLWTRDGTLLEPDAIVLNDPRDDYEYYLVATGSLRSAHMDYDEERWFFTATTPGESIPVRLNDGIFKSRVVNITSVSRQPKIFVIDDFLTEEECDGIMQHALNLPAESTLSWTESTVGIDTIRSSAGNQYRVSSTLWLGRIHSNSNQLTDAVTRRAQNLLKVPTEVMEPLQVVRYPPGGHYYFHTDSFSPSDRGPNPYVSGGGNRLATLLIYVNSPSGGGHTAFPMAEGSGVAAHDLSRNAKKYCDTQYFHVEAKKGRAVLFYDLDEKKHMEGLYDPLTHHAGCDTEGESEKWIMNQWVRNKRVNVNGKFHLYDENW